MASKLELTQLAKILNEQTLHMDEDLALELASHCKKNNINVEVGKFSFDTWYVRKLSV